MSPNRFVISDTHFGHSNILTFTHGPDNKPVRSFSSVEEMDETIINNWNKIVKPNDVVYHLGDVVINKKFLSTIERCNGSKRLILGNHDPYLDLYGLYFKKVYAMRIYPKDLIMTHVPIHPDCVHRFKRNLHGHIHTNTLNDPRYRNCCVDFPGDDYFPANNYMPLSLESIRDDFKKLGD